MSDKTLVAYFLDHSILCIYL